MNENNSDMRDLFRQTDSNAADLVVHLSLGVAAIIAIVSAVSAIGDFAARRDSVAAALSPSPASIAGSTGDGVRDQAMTNLPGVSVEIGPSQQPGPANPPASEPSAAGPALPTG